MIVFSFFSGGSLETGIQSALNIILKAYQKKTI